MDDEDTPLGQHTKSSNKELEFNLLTRIQQKERDIKSNLTCSRSSSKPSLKQSVSIERMHMGFIGSSANTAQKILLNGNQNKNQPKKYKKQARVVCDDLKSNDEHNVFDVVEEQNEQF